MKLFCVLALAAATRTAAADDAWTREIIDRPLTLRRGMIAAGGELGLVRTQFTDLGGDTTSETTETALVAGRYGITDRIEAGVAYGLALDPFEAKGPIVVGAAVGVIDRERLKVAPAAAFTYNLASEIADVRGGAAVLYKITPRLAAFAPATQIRVTTKVPIGMGAPIPKPIDIDLPVGVGLQASERVFATLVTRLARIGIQDSDTAILFVDQTPFAVGMSYSPSNKLDFALTLDVPNAGDIGDVFTISIGARLFVL